VPGTPFSEKESMARLLLTAACLVTFLHSAVSAQITAPASAKGDDADLKFVVYFSRHGVRSPTGKAVQYNKFSKAEWPDWNVPPGNLTTHGLHLMELFGAYDRMELANEKLLSAEGCTDADKVSFYADSDQRTRETANALAKGLFPQCNIAVPSLPEGTNDPLFHLPPADVARADVALTVAAIGGRIGNNPNTLTEAYRPQLAAFDNILATCGKASPNTAKRTSLFNIPATLSAGQGDHLAELRGPLNTASTLAENLLLEYTEGLDMAQVGWGCVDGSTIRSLIALHTAATDFTQRTPAIARMQASNLLDHIHAAMEQAVEQHPIPGALSKRTDRALFLIGHDTNLLNMAGVLNLTWIVDGRRDDTPPGGALIFELWKRRGTGNYEVRVYFSAQTLEQMRFAKPLTPGEPPQRVPVFIPGCSQADFSCSWSSFSQLIREASDTRRFYSQKTADATPNRAIPPAGNSRNLSR
jgi:4-phytase / acid phosphatase